MKSVWKFAVIVCSLALMFTITSCDNDDDNDNALAQVSVNLKNLTNSWRSAMAYYAQGSIAKHGLYPYYMTSAKDGEEQAKQLQMVINSGTRVIVLSPEGVAEAEVNAAIKRRIPVILFEEEMNVEYTALVQGDNTGAGKNAATYIIDKGVSKVAAFRVAQDPVSSNARVGTFATTLTESASGIELIEVTLDQYSREDGRKFTASLLNEHPDIEAIYAQDDEIAMGVLDVLKETIGHNVKVIIGCGGNKEYLALIGSTGDIDLATTLYSPSMISKCIDIAADLLKGIQPEEKKVIMPATLINKSNYAEYLDSSSPY